MKLAIAHGLVALLVTALPSAAPAADTIAPQVSGPIPSLDEGPSLVRSTVAGRASAIDGRTLWLPERAQLVRLDGIGSCELPQWSYDPTQHRQSTIPKPVPCGPLAKAWLKRSLGNDQVSCRVVSYAEDGALIGRCFASGRDLALEMLRVGWARTTTSAPTHYLAWQDHAMSARYGMWATYVLDMDEWRRKAINQTLYRMPIADFHLLAERESEISPPFADARRRPKRVDR
jgi:endonuclease YncB( thermonuclease family)